MSLDAVDLGADESDNQLWDIDAPGAGRRYDGITTLVCVDGVCSEGG